VIALDHRVEHWVVAHRAEPFDTIFVWLTRAGTYGIVWLVLAAVAAILWRRPSVFVLVVVAWLVAEGATDVLKAAIGRARPVDHPLVHRLHSHSFPSGHAATSFACAATLARFTTRGQAVALYVLAAAIAYSRVYVGVHWPLDVVAGAVLGLLIATALRMLRAGRLRSRRARRAG
jgi:undecaprenyl-diphosphatase